MPDCIYCPDKGRFLPRKIGNAEGGADLPADVIEHLESVHSVVIQRPGETEDEAEARYEAGARVRIEALAADLIIEADTGIRPERPQTAAPVPAAV